MSGRSRTRGKPKNLRSRRFKAFFESGRLSILKIPAAVLRQFPKYDAKMIDRRLEECEFVIYVYAYSRTLKIKKNISSVEPAPKKKSMKFHAISLHIELE